jgi:Secretion system C-terminal sorting domain
MKKNSLVLYFIVLQVFQQHTVFGQTCLNGSFEATTGNCNFNLLNADFNVLVSNCYGIGDASQIDLIKDTCGYGPAQEGNYFIGLAVNNTDVQTDAISLKLSEPLTAGNMYLLNFYHKKSSNYNANLLDVGYSTDSLTFGEYIDLVALPTMNWELVTLSFTPTSNGQFLTIKVIAGSYGWNFIDNVTITQTSAGVNEFFIEDSDIQLMPNPSSGFISLMAEVSCNIIFTRIKDVQGNTVLLTKEKNIDLSDFAAGLYLAEITTDKGIISKRFVRQ